MDEEGIRYGFATSASNVSTATAASVIVSAQSTSVLSGVGRRDRDLSRMRTAIRVPVIELTNFDKVRAMRVTHAAEGGCRWWAS